MCNLLGSQRGERQRVEIAVKERKEKRGWCGQEVSGL
jgi:hypothetical protein